MGGDQLGISLSLLFVKEFVSILYIEHCNILEEYLKSLFTSSARLEGGMVHPPPTGWGGKEYVLFTSKFDHHHHIQGQVDPASSG